MTKSTCYCLDRYIMKTAICAVSKLDTIGPIEEFNLSESAARLLGLMSKSKCTPVATRKDPVGVSSEHSVD